MYFVEAETESDRPFAWLAEDALLDLLRSSAQMTIARDRIVPKPKGKIYLNYWIWLPLGYAAFVYGPLFVTGAIIVGYLCEPLALPGMVIALIAGVIKGFAVAGVDFEQCKRGMEETRLNAGTKEIVMDLSAGQLRMHEHFSLSGEQKTTSSPLSEVQVRLVHDIDNNSDTVTESIEVRLDSFRHERASAWARNVLGRSLRSYAIAEPRIGQKLQAESRAKALIQAINDKLVASGHPPLTIATR